MATLNLGILAHVDAGKTSLTERLLHAAGVIGEVGRVDAGSTQTDTLALERARGITIRSAVVAFELDGVVVNLIDTPGHPDFIAEVERVLDVLDGVVLVVSAVEGVQPQTRVLMRTLRRLRIPTLIFVNKIDRTGARRAAVLDAIADKLISAAVPMGTTSGLGTREANFTPYSADAADFTSALVDVLTVHDDELLAAYVADASTVAYDRLREVLAAQTRRALVCPVFFGSAITGAGVRALMRGIAELLPPADADADGPVSGTVFKIERGPTGEKIAYVRLFSGVVRARDTVRFGDGRQGKVTAVEATAIGTAGPGAYGGIGAVAAGQIGRLWGLGEIRIGDRLGAPRSRALGDRCGGPAGAPAAGHFAPPTLETVVVPDRRQDLGALHAALTQLAEQDPLIGLRLDDGHGELSVSLYGEVQKEVVQATLADDYGIGVSFRDTTTICIERPVGSGAAAEFIGDDANPFRATVGLRIDPAAVGSGIRFHREVELGSLPYAFFRAVEETVRRTLRQGLRGWQVTDCTVSMTHSGYTPPPPYGWSKWSSSARDFRNLTPLVVMRALRDAGTRVYEPMHRFRLDAPADAVGGLLAGLARVRAVATSQTQRGTVCMLEGEIPAARVHELSRRLPALTRGEGLLETDFARYQDAVGSPPIRPRTDGNPLDRADYLLHLRRRL